MQPTYKDIQRETGLALSTISKYFNGGNLRDDNRIAIDEAVKKLDYKINTFARALRSNSSHTIGVLLPELTSSFHTAIVSDLAEELRRNGYGTIICDCNLNKKRERDSLEFLLDKMVDGIITIVFDPKGEHLKMVEDREVPIVLVDRLVENRSTDAVIVNNAMASELAVNEFVEANHSEIAIISASNDFYTMSKRTDGFISALKSKGIEPNPEFVVCGEMTVEGGYIGAKKLMSLENRPTALFCANYELTLGAIMALNELGIKIYDDISLIGMDNLTLARVVKPKLTMVMQPMREIALRAASLMLARLSSDSKAELYNIAEFKPKIQQGNSVRVLRKGEKN